MYLPDKIKREVKHCDWIIFTVFALMLLSRFFTIGYFNIIQTETKASIEAIHTVYEASFVSKAILNLQQTGIILSFILMPGLGMAVYIFYRKRVLSGRLNIEVLELFVNFAMFAFLVNVFNDMGALLGQLFKGL